MAPAVSKIAVVHNMTAAILSSPIPTVIRTMSTTNGTTVIVNEPKGSMIVGIVAAVLAGPPAGWVVYKAVMLLFKWGVGDDGNVAATAAAVPGAAAGDLEMGIVAEPVVPQGADEAAPGEAAGDGDIADERVEDAVEDDRNILLAGAAGVEGVEDAQGNGEV